jgi:DNA-binding beta-propeller fold protein YncE
MRGGLALKVRRRRNRAPGRHLAQLFFAAMLTVLAFTSSANAADRIYWSNFGTSGTISFAKLDGSGGGGDLNTTGATPTNPAGVAIDAANGRIYWGSPGSTISFANLDGSGDGGDLSTPGATVSGPEGLAVDPGAGRIYWANATGEQGIYFANLDGSGGGGSLNTAGATLSSPTGVAVDPGAGRIYWSNATPANKISFANLDGSGGGDINTTGATVDNPHGVAVDPAARRIYWANTYGEKVSYASLDNTGGGDLDTTGATVINPAGVAIDAAAGRIYWGNAAAEQISFANLDGSGGGDLNTSGATANGPNYPVLLKAPSGTGVPAISRDGETLRCSRGDWAADLLGSFVYRAPQSFAYRWLKDGAEIAGADQATYGPGEPGAYACRVTAANEAGAATQTSAAVQISEAVTGRARAARIAKVKGGRALLKLRCSGTAACAGVANLLVAPKVGQRGPGRTGKRSKRLLIGRSAFSIPAGTTRVVPVKLSRKGRGLVRAARRHRLKVKLAGTGVESRAVVLKVP